MPTAVPGPPGPVKRLWFGSISVPLYMLRFDKHGACRGPRTYQALLDDLRRGSFTHVFVCSHGWNTTYSAALARYEDFVTGFHALRETRGLPVPDPYRPVVVGISWPSIDLLMPGENAPKIAAIFGAVPAEGTSEAEDAAATDRQSVTELSAEMAPERARRFAELTARESLSPRDAAELAGLLADSRAASGDELGGELPDDGPPVTAEAVMAVWEDLLEAGFGAADGQPTGPDSFHAPVEDLPAGGPGTGHAEDEPRSAGIADLISTIGASLDPRPILRAVTVRTMKDRAGVVGAAGVGPLLTDLLTAAPAASVHLTGHSYGCRLLLAALCTGSLPRPVDSLLLLQPAVNYLCFATQVPKTGQPGGFRPALDHVRQPVLSTFSAHDAALHDFFHLAVRRRADLGEPQMALLGQVPSLYCALGGWGPGGMADDEAAEIGLAACPDRYDLGSGAVRVYGVRGDSGIRGHSDVVNDFTFWALYNQVTG